MESNICINSGTLNNLFLLPIVGLMVRYGKNKCTFNCLFDSRSQRSNFSKDKVYKLNCKDSRMSSVIFDVKTFISSQVKDLKENTLNLEISPNKFIIMPILINNMFKINF